MNIVLLHYAAHPTVGGVENVMRQHSRMMAAAGHRVRVIAGRGAKVDPEVDFTCLPLVDSRAPEILEAKKELDAGRIPSTFEALSVQIEEQLQGNLVHVDWVFAHNVCSLAKNLPLTAALSRMSRRPGAMRIGLWHHDLAWTTPRYASELHSGYPWDLLRTDWPHAVQITVSEHRRKELAGLLGVPAGRIVVIPNGIDVAAFLKLGSQTNSLIAPLHLLEAAPLILLPARITPRKNIELGLRILVELKKRFPEARLVITGPAGPHNPANASYLDSLLALRQDLALGESVVFLTLVAGSEISDEVVSDLYRMADVLLLPSKEEGFGIPILEAGLARVPVFCAGIAPLRELGEDHVTYFLPDDDPAKITTELGRALDTSDRYLLRKKILRDFAWPQIYAKHVAPLLEGGKR